MRRSHLRLIFLLVTALFFSASIHAAERVALVIGNGAYEKANQLPNATRDALAVAQLLEEQGFMVIHLPDAGVEAIYEGLEKFKRAAGSGSTRVGLFYYAGHGLEVDGKNYILPVDASLDSEAQLRTQTVSLDTVLTDMKTANIAAKMVILDCCRNNPLSRSWMTTRSMQAGGLSALPDAAVPPATMIMYASAPGTVALDGVGGNSPFTTALVQHLAEPGLSAFDAFLGISDAVAKSTGEMQVPWIKFDGAGRSFRLFTLGPDAPAANQTTGLSPHPEPMSATAREQDAMEAISVYTSTAMEDATVLSSAELDGNVGDYMETLCKGEGGYELLHRGGERNWIDVRYQGVTSDLYQATMEAGRGNFVAKEDDVVEWRGFMKDGVFKPYAIIYRVMAQDPEDAFKNHSTLIVIALNEGNAKIIGTAYGENESAEARKRADTAAP